MPSSVEVLGKSVRNEDACDILKEEGRAPKKKLAGREGVEVGIDVEQFGADHADEQQREPVLARGRPVDIEPERGRKKDADEFLTALTKAELHGGGG